MKTAALVASLALGGCHALPASDASPIVYRTPIDSRPFLVRFVHSLRIDTNPPLESLSLLPPTALNLRELTTPQRLWITARADF